MNKFEEYSNFIELMKQKYEKNIRKINVYINQLKKLANLYAKQIRKYEEQNPLDNFCMWYGNIIKKCNPNLQLKAFNELYDETFKKYREWAALGDFCSQFKKIIEKHKENHNHENKQALKNANKILLDSFQKLYEDEKIKYQGWKTFGDFYTQLGKVINEYKKIEKNKVLQKKDKLHQLDDYVRLFKLQKPINDQYIKHREWFIRIMEKNYEKEDDKFLWLCTLYDEAKRDYKIHHPYHFNVLFNKIWEPFVQIMEKKYEKEDDKLFNLQRFYHQKIKILNPEIYNCFMQIMHEPKENDKLKALCELYKEKIIPFESSCFKSINYKNDNKKYSIWKTFKAALLLINNNLQILFFYLSPIFDLEQKLKTEKAISPNILLSLNILTICIDQIYGNLYTLAKSFKCEKEFKKRINNQHSFNFDDLYEVNKYPSDIEYFKFIRSAGVIHQTTTNRANERIKKWENELYSGLSRKWNIHFKLYEKDKIENIDACITAWNKDSWVQDYNWYPVNVNELFNFLFAILQSIKIIKEHCKGYLENIEINR